MHGFTEFNGAAKSPEAKKPPVSPSGLFESLQLIEITRESPMADIEALVGKDAVHAAGTQSVEEIIKYRLGGAAFNRTCFAVRDLGSGELQSAIYVQKTYNHITTPRDLPGNVRDILSTPVAEMVDALETVFAFFSITRLGKVKGAGEVLISKVHDLLSQGYPNAVRTTLSPLRQPTDGTPGIDDYLQDHAPDWDVISDTQRRTHVLNFLLQKREGVECFHLGNGADIGDIKLNADLVGRRRVMVNYRYSMDKAAMRSNALTFRNAANPVDLLPLVSPLLARETQIHRLYGQAIPDSYTSAAAPGAAPV